MLGPMYATAATLFNDLAAVVLTYRFRLTKPKKTEQLVCIQRLAVGRLMATIEAFIAHCRSLASQVCVCVAVWLRACAAACVGVGVCGCSWCASSAWPWAA